MPKEPTLLIVGPRRGRPRVDHVSSTVSTWIAAEDHDRLIALANANEQSVSATVRQLLIERIRTPR